MERISGIYCYENMITGKKYIGQSIDLNRRHKVHEREFKKNKESYKILENKYLWEDVQLFGRNNFKFYVLKVCKKCELNNLEVYYIKTRYSHISSGGYNISWGGASSTKGRKLTQEHKDNITKAMKKRGISEDNMKKIIEGIRKRFLNKEERIKNSLLLRKNSINLDYKSLNVGIKRSGCSSKYFGICIIKPNSRNKKEYWKARCGSHRIGTYKTELDAAKAYDLYVKDNNLKYPTNFEGV